MSAEIVGCACGEDHETMPVEDCGDYTYDLVCRTHKRHIPCRKCFREEGVWMRYQRKPVSAG